ncbi:MAG: MFS transporter [Nitrospiraceae bacterium]|nr:MFS transporter [Nitrospiraceae bacterium]
MLLITSDLLRALLIGLIPCLIPVESFTVSVLYVLVLLHAIASAVFGPALTASIPAFVPKTQFTAANALLQGTTSLGIILGPAMSGLGIAAYGSQEVLCLNAATYVISAACLMLVRFSKTAVITSSLASPPTMLQDLKEGFRYCVVTQPGLLLLTGTAALHTFGSSALSALFPVFATKMLGLGPVEVGYLWSALGVGLLLTSIGLLWVTDWMVKNRLVVDRRYERAERRCSLRVDVDGRSVRGGTPHGTCRLWVRLVYTDCVGDHSRGCPKPDDRACTGALWDRRHDCCHRRNLCIRLDHGTIGT